MDRAAVAGCAITNRADRAAYAGRMPHQFSTVD
jgi:hypothetical protein